jgi:outer membrane protein assembly factor BamE (lipoprotein component of BamABCDE complex)
MDDLKWHMGWVACLAVFLCLLLLGCAPKVTTGAFTNVSSLDQQLKRGVSTKMEVQKLLGAPNGFGSSVVPTDPWPREVWYYEDIEGTDYKSEEGVVTMNMRQQILLIFFEKGVLDGYMWTSNSGKGEVRQ